MAGIYAAEHARAGGQADPVGAVALRRPRLSWTFALAVLAVLTGMGSLVLPPVPASWVIGVSWMAGGGAAVLAIGSRLRLMSAAEQRAWRMFFAASACFVVGLAIWEVLFFLDSPYLFGSVADAFWLAMAPLLVVGVYRAGAASAGLSSVARLDVVALVAAGGSLGVLACADAIATTQVGTLGTVVAVAYSSFFLAAAAAVLHVFVTRFRVRQHPDIALLVVGFTLIGLAFALYGLDVLGAAYVTGTEWYDPLWTLGLLAFAAAARLTPLERPVPRPSERELRTRALVPAVAAAAVISALIAEVFHIDRGSALGPVVLLVSLFLIVAVFSARYWLLSAEHARLFHGERTARLEAEHARELQDRFLDLVPEGLVILDVEGRIVRANRSISSALDASAADLIGRSAVDFVDERDAEAVGQSLRHVAAAGGLASFEGRMVTGDGTRRWMHWNVTRDEERSLLYAAGQDVTQRKEAELALRDSQARFSELVNTIPEVFFLLDQEDTAEMIYISPTCQEVWGRAPDSVSTLESWLETIHPDDRAAALARSLSVNAGETAHYEYRIVRPDGEVRWIYEVKSPIFDAEGNVVRQAGIATDVTARKQTEESLAARERLLSAIVEGQPECVKLVAPDGTITMMNASGLAMLCVPLERVIGQRWRDFAAPAQRDSIDAAIQAGLRGEHSSVAFTCMRGDGREAQFESSVAPLRDSDGAVTGLVSVTRDVTERRELERRLLHSQKLDAVGQLAGGVAHDFNNILTAMIGYADFARLAATDADPAIRDGIDEVLAGARRASELTRRLLSFARREVVRPQVVDLNEVIGDMVAFLRRMIGENIDVSVVPAARPLPAVVDTTQLEQVLLNLTLNARDAMTDGGTLEISADEVVLSAADAAAQGVEPGPYCRLRVSDTGIGIPDDVRERVFEPFFTTKGAGEGTGLGLATVYGIVQQAGGAVSVESAEGLGTTFTVLLPRTDAEPASRASEPGSAATEGGEKILLVEDDAAVRAVVAAALEDDGYDVVVADSPEAALAAAGASFELLVTDVVMPKIDGPTLARDLRAAHPELRVLFMSGYSGDTMVERGALTSADDLLQKPFSLQELKVKVREVLDVVAVPA